MKVKDVDLYSNGYIEEFADGLKFLERDEIEYNGNDTDRFYTVRATDRLTKIAYRKYKDILKLPQHYWWIIADANDIENPMDLSGLIGEEIVIPDPFLFLLNV